jgi:hypothetical protein
MLFDLAAYEEFEKVVEGGNEHLFFSVYGFPKGGKKNIKGQINPKKEFHLWIDRPDLAFISGSRAMREMVRHGMIAREKRTPRIENIPASLPVKGIMIPPSPKAKPIMRLETIDLPLGASSCAMATPSGKVAIAKNPAKKAPQKTQLPLR